jgi:hypothetical protein
MSQQNRESAARGAPLAENASPETTPPDPFEDGEPSPREADGLTQDAKTKGPPPDPDEPAQDAVRDDGLA